MGLETRSEMHQLLFFLFLKTQDGGRPMRLSDPFCITTRCRVSLIVNMAAVSHHKFLKLKFLTAVHFKDVVNPNAKFCVGMNLKDYLNGHNA